MRRNDNNGLLRGSYNSEQSDNRVRDSAVAAIWCVVGGYWGLHEIYLNRPVMYLVRNGLLAAIIALSDFISSNIPVTMYMALVSLESIALIRGKVPFNSRSMISLSKPSTATWVVSHALTLVVLIGALCVGFVPA